MADFTMVPKSATAPAATATVDQRAAATQAVGAASQYAPSEDLGPAVTQDGQNLRNEVYAQAYAALSALPEGTRKAEAFKVAWKAQTSFLNMVAQGTPPGTAIENARNAVSFWISEAADQQGVQPGQSIGSQVNGANAVGSADIKDAQAVYTEAVKAGRDLYGNVSAGPTNPRPTDIASTPVQVGFVDASQVSDPGAIDVARQERVVATGADPTAIREAGQVNITPGAVTAGAVTPEQMAEARRLEAALQRGVTVEGANTTELQKIEQGQGAIQNQTAALLRLSGQRDLERKMGLVNQARGTDRAGALRQVLRDKSNLEQEDRIVAQQTAQQLAATNKLADLDQQKKQLQAQLDSARAANDQNAINSIQTKMAELDQQREATNAQLRQSAAEGNVNRQVEAQKFNVAQKTDVEKFAAAQRLAAESKASELEQQVQLAQANLDQARASGDQQAINAASMKLADLKQRTAETNAQLQQDATKSNVDRDFEAQKFDVDTRLRAQQQEEQQRVADADMRIRAQKALEDSARGLLSEDQRQQELERMRQQMRIAEEELRMAQSRNDREAAKAAQERIGFWADMAGRLLGSATRAMATGGAAAKGGVVTKPTQLLVGEGEHDEIVIPVTGLSRELAKALAVENKPFEEPVPMQRLLRALKGTQPEPDEEIMPPKGIAILLAPDNIRARKASY